MRTRKRRIGEWRGRERMENKIQERRNKHPERKTSKTNSDKDTERETEKGTKETNIYTRASNTFPKHCVTRACDLQRPC